MADGVSAALCRARKECFSDEDRYWHGSNASFEGPLNPRNEAAALSRLLVSREDVCKGSAEAEQQLQELCSSYCRRVAAPQPAAEASSSNSDSAGQSGAPFPDDSAETQLLRWCLEQGMTSDVLPALFPLPGGQRLRGLAAGRELKPGEAAITVPKQMLISYDYVMASDLGKVLQRIPGLSHEAAAVVWTMVERQDPESTLSHFWRALPQHLGTGLSVRDGDLHRALPRGSPLREEAEAARKHLREQHQLLQPVYTTLCTAYPSYFKAQMFAWEQFLWAAELWYAYAISVQLQADSSDLQPCLVPLVSLMNHSPLPHIVHYSKVDTASGKLRLMLFRPAAAGQEVTLSYGPLPNAKLLLFYGFTVHNNPFDSAVVPLEAASEGQPDPQADIRQALLQASGLDPRQQRVRAGTGLAEELRACARLLAASRKELLMLKKSKRDLGREVQKPLSEATEKAALQLLHGSLQRLQGMYSEAVQAQQGGTTSAGTAEVPADVASMAEESNASMEQVGQAFVLCARVWLEGQLQAVTSALAKVNDLL